MKPIVEQPPTSPCLLCGLRLAILVFAVSGCGPASSDVDFMKLVKETKAQNKTAQIKAAVLPLLATNELDRSHDSIKVPKVVADLPIFRGEAALITVWGVGNKKREERGLAFVTGSGFGHWGIVVCPYEDGEEAARTLRGKVIPWDNDVFFFKEW